MNQRFTYFKHEILNIVNADDEKKQMWIQKERKTNIFLYITPSCCVFPENFFILLLLLPFLLHETQIGNLQHIFSFFYQKRSHNSSFLDHTTKIDDAKSGKYKLHKILFCKKNWLKNFSYVGIVRSHGRLLAICLFGKWWIIFVVLW